MELDHFIAEHIATLDDFWHRRSWDSAETQHLSIFGQPLHLRTADPQAVTAVNYALTAYSSAPAVDVPPIHLNIAVRPASWPIEAPPRDLYPKNSFVGGDNWLMIHIGAWGHAHVNLATRTATIVATPELVRETDIMARGILHTVLTNLLFATGYAMLHCTALLKGARLLMLIAPHNSGKSTTALRLALSGLEMMSDSQIYVSPFHEPLHVMGFPVGRARLRKDMLPSFPQLHDFLQPEAVRGETKFSFKLQDFDPSLVQPDAIAVDEVDLCLLRLGNSAETAITPASDAELWDAVMQNSLFYDSKAQWRKNLQSVTPLLKRARAHHLIVGSDPAGIVQSVDALLTDR